MIRTTLAAAAALALAKFFNLAEPHWAPISALVVTQSTFAASLPISVQRLVGTAFGAVIGAMISAACSSLPHLNIWIYTAAIFAIGLVCSMARVDRAAYRYAAITCTIVLLLTRNTHPFQTAYERFLEVSIGIVIGLLAAALPLERKRAE